MTSFRYLCLDHAGNELSGSISAETLAAARRLLRERGFSVVSLAEARSRGGRLKRNKISDQDLYNMARELYVLLKAGVRIDDSLEIVASSATNLNLKELLSSLLGEVRAGKSLSDACSGKGDVFPPLMVNVIRVGESVGDLKMAFEHIAGHLQFQIQFRAEIKNALTYPIFLTVASLVTLTVIFRFIIPRFFSVFGENQEKLLPFAAKLLYGASKLMNGYFLAGAVVAGLLLYKYVDVKKLFHWAYSRAVTLPLARGMIINLELSRFSYAMYTMLSSGLEFIKAIRFSTDLIQNDNIRGYLDPAIKLIREGQNIGDVFSQVDILPDIVVSMVRVGERSGNMKEVFLELFHVFDDRFKRSIKKVMVLIEPAIITIMGIVVGFIVISLILTVMSVGNIKL
ncbi:MAG: type II secretion system F family protein [Nitrospirae bacterium]|nr:type II secretion system F family protein [Nitrospirota bacterium]